MTHPLLPAARVGWLLIRLRLRRLVNLAGTLNRRGNKQRSGTASKRTGSALLTALLVLAMVLAYGNLAHEAVGRLARLAAEPPLAGGAAFGPALLHLLSVETALLTLAGVLVPLGSRELAQADWDLEWLVTLPVDIGPLLWARIAERSVANAFGLLALWPACTVLAWQAGLRHGALPAGVLAALPLLALAAMARTIVDTGLRLRLAPSRLRNLQAAISVASILVFYLTISPATAVAGRFLLPIAQRLPDWISWTPPGLVLRALGAASPAQAAIAGFLLLVETGLLLAAGMQLLRALLARGVAAAGARESARAKPASAGRPPARATAGWALASPVQRRELTLLARDRNFLVQTMVLPVLIVGVQWVLNGRAESLAQLWASPQLVAAAAFGVSAYALMLSAFQTLAAEGGALWMLYTFPLSIEAVLRDKARLWGVLALAYPVIGFGCMLALGPPVSAASLGLMAMVVLAVPTYSAIAVALGVFGCDPLATDARHRLKVGYVYLYMLLSGLYVGAFFAPHWWQSLVSVVLAVLLALALWQKARDQLPYLLDPVAGPPARVSTADGLIATMMFFALQLTIGALVAAGGRAQRGADTVVVFALAGGLTYAGVRLVHWRAKALDAPRMFGGQWRRALATGAAFGLGAAVLGIAYLQAVHGLGLLEAPARRAHGGGVANLGAWVVPLGVLAAPVFEEFIFRGLIFGGLRRSMGLLPAAAASAAVFAIVHPPLSMLPVFALGLCAAWAYERSRLLLAPMVVHAVYNAAVIGWQSYGPGVAG
ncbi:CPBP family intramembrane glutamic endopeptidase [Caenimonas terrae]|uniref:CPBP family intramembrane glutamic endopeptidase n=1 Tax=Caenimonas terrae TaxID=696074 RepID=A0ABW0NH59_9BURK